MPSRRAELNPLKELAVAVGKGQVDLLGADSGQDDSSVLVSSFVQATRLQIDRPHAALDPAQYGLQAALYRRLTSLARSKDASRAAQLSQAISWILSSHRQLPIVDKVTLALNESSKEVSRAAWEALQAYVALAATVGSTSPAVNSDPILAPACRALVSEAFRPNKGVYQILALLVPTFPAGRLAQLAPDLPTTLLAGMSSADNISFRGALLGAVLSKVYADQAASSGLWQWPAAVDALAQHLLTCDPATRFNVIQFAIRPVAEAHPKALIGLVKQVEAADGATLHIEEAWIALVSLGASLSLCSDIGSAATPLESSLIPIPTDRLKTILSHPSPVVRLGVYRLVTDRSAVGAPVTLGEWEIAQAFLEGSMNVWDSEARSNIIVRTAHLLRRLKNSSHTAHRQLQGLRARPASDNKDAEGARVKELEIYLARSAHMLNWIIENCFANLLIGGSYPRSFVSLRLLGLVVASSACEDFPTFAADVQSLPGLKSSETIADGKTSTKSIFWPSQVTLYPPNEDGRRRVRKLLRCLKSTFIDVRSCALALLEQASSDMPGLSEPDSIVALVKEALAYASNPRGTESSTGALILRLVFTLKAKRADAEQNGTTFVSTLISDLMARLILSREDVILAASNNPVHGLFSALQQIMPLLPAERAADQLFSDALEAITLSWECTRPILSSVDTGEAADDENSVDHEEARAAKIVSAQSEAGGRREREMLLSWAWRTMRESSALLSIVASRLLQQPTIGVQTVHKIGALFISFLSEIRHPGAFLSIFPHYSEVVAAIASSAVLSAEIKALPAGWLQTHLTTVSGFHKTSGRRSAGLPYAILGVGLGQPSLIPEAFAALFELASDGQEETTQIASINTLKVLCNNAKMAADLARVYEQAVTVAMRSLSSTSWGVRNVGLQLMGALVKKGFSKSAAANGEDVLNVWFAKYPSLHGLFLASLGAISQEELDTSPGAAFVILQFLRCLKASPSETTLQDAFLPHLDRFARCSQIDIRLAAAAATPALVPATAVGSFILAAGLLLRPQSQNALHGKLSQILILLQETVRSLSYAPGKGLIEHLRQAQYTMLSQNRCPPTQALFIQVIQATMTKTADLPDDVFAATRDFCINRVQSAFDTAPGPGEDAVGLAAARFIIARHETAVLLDSPHPEVVEVALSEPSFVSASLDERMTISGIAISSDSSLRSRLEALAWAQRYSPFDFTKVPPSRWDRLLAEFEESVNQPLRQALLTVLGKAIGQCATEDRVQALLAHLTHLSQETQSVENRLAVVAALRGCSPTLAAFAETSSAARLSYHILVGRLLVDDDAEVRDNAGLLVAHTLGGRPAGLAHGAAVQRWDDFTLRRCASMSEYRAALWTSLAAELDDGRFAAESSELELVLFAAEPENAFREAEVDVRRTASLLCRALAKAPTEELAERRAELNDIRNRLDSALATKEGAALTILPGAAEDERELARCRVKALADALA